MNGMDFFEPALLARRLTDIPLTDTVRGFFFLSALKAVRAAADEALLARCIEAGGGGSFLSYFNYPASSFIRLVDTAATELSGKYGSFAGAVRYLGQQLVPDFLESPSGKALLFLSGGSPKLMLGSIPGSWEATMNHGKCRVEWHGATAGTLVIQGNALPYAYYEGAIQQTVDVTQMQGVTVQGQQRGLLDCEVKVSWG